MDIYITRETWYRQARYQIWRDGKVIYTFFAQPHLTWSQESDVLDLYREALEYWSD